MITADMVFRSDGGPGGVRTQDPGRPRAEAVAVAGDRIVAVGTDEDVTELIGPRTEVVDLTGRVLLPGFQDAHVHPLWGGVERMQCDLTDAGSVPECQQRVRDYAAADPGRPWVAGGGWSMALFPGGMPTRQMLDAAVADRPALLLNRDHHGAWANSRALELAGIDGRTADPVDGRIERELGGTPTGYLHEGAVDLVSRVQPAMADADRLHALEIAQAHLHSLGITAWQDAIVGDYCGHPDPLRVYLEAARSGLLTARVRGALWWDRHGGADQIDDLIDRRDRARGAGGRFVAGTVKIMQDGVPEYGTASLSAPYLDLSGRSTGRAGTSFLDPAELRERVTDLDRHGFQVHVHAIGDRAVRESLDAFADARERNGPSAGRHHVAHVQVVHPDDVPRFAELDVAATIQPLWAAHEPQMDELTIPVLGPERAGWQYPFRSLLDSGARLAGGSDWPVTRADPLAGIGVAVTRVAPDDAGPPFLPAQRLDLAAALRAYTAGSAYVNHLDRTGTITPGMLADLVVLDTDPFAVPPSEFWRIGADLTVVGGAVVHRRAS